MPLHLVAAGTHKPTWRGRGAAVHAPVPQLACDSLVSGRYTRVRERWHALTRTHLNALTYPCMLLCAFPNSLSLKPRHLEMHEMLWHGLKKLGLEPFVERDADRQDPTPARTPLTRAGAGVTFCSRAPGAVGCRGIAAVRSDPSAPLPRPAP
jgi:hypothetical protein